MSKPRASVRVPAVSVELAGGTSRPTSTLGAASGEPPTSRLASVASADGAAFPSGEGDVSATGAAFPSREAAASVLTASVASENPPAVGRPPTCRRGVGEATLGAGGGSRKACLDHKAPSATAASRAMRACGQSSIGVAPSGGTTLLVALALPRTSPCRTVTGTGGVSSRGVIGNRLDKLLGNQSWSGNRATRYGRSAIGPPP
jgi:hypothetical protein